MCICTRYTKWMPLTVSCSYCWLSVCRADSKLHPEVLGICGKSTQNIIESQKTLLLINLSKVYTCTDPVCKI